MKWTLIISSLVALFVSQAVACSTEEIQTKIDCFQYCRQAAECNGDVNTDECEQTCEDALGDCMADELDAAQDQLDLCAEESCDDFTACTIDVGAQCYFGL